MILVKNFSTWIFLKSEPTCPREWTVYRKNKNNSVEYFKMDGNRQKCQKFSRLNRFEKLQESIDHYLLHVNISEFLSVLSIFLIYSQPLPFFLTVDIIRYILTKLVLTAM